MDNSKCDCGAVKTYGENATTHSDWCSALKPEEPKPRTGFPWGDGGGYDLADRKSLNDLFKEIYSDKIVDLLKAMK